MSIELVIRAETLDGLMHELRSMAVRMLLDGADPAPEGGGAFPPEVPAAGEQPAPAPARRGRKPGSKNATTEAAPAEPEAQPEPEAEAEEDLFGGPAPATVETRVLTPQEAAALATEMLGPIYTANGGEFKPDVKALAAQYGIAQFKDLPLDKAHQFLADVQALDLKRLAAAA